MHCRSGHAAGVVTSFDVRTLLKVYRTSSNDGSDNEVLDRLLRMRARALEEKFNEVESDVSIRSVEILADVPVE